MQQKLYLSYNLYTPIHMCTHVYTHEYTCIHSHAHIHFHTNDLALYSEYNKHSIFIIIFLLSSSFINHKVDTRVGLFYLFLRITTCLIKKYPSSSLLHLPSVFFYFCFSLLLMSEQPSKTLSHLFS